MPSSSMSSPNSLQVPPAPSTSKGSASKPKEASGWSGRTSQLVLDLEKGGGASGSTSGAVDYVDARAKWVRTAALSANDGLVSVASLMICGGADNRTTAKAVLVSGLAGLAAAVCSMAVGKFVSVYAQYDIEAAQMKRPKNTGGEVNSGEGEERDEATPIPVRAAAASALAFALGFVIGGVPPLLAGGFISTARSGWGVRVGAVCGVTSVGLAGLGAAGGFLGGGASSTTTGKSAIRVLVGGWLSMLLSYGVLKLFGLAFNMHISPA